jgi:hypothetical protein
MDEIVVSKSVESLFQEIYTLLQLEGKFEDQKINDLLLRRKLRDLFELLRQRGLNLKDANPTSDGRNSTDTAASPETGHIEDNGGQGNGIESRPGNETPESGKSV